MKNIRTKTGIIGLIVMAAISTLSAQESTTLHFMKGMRQSDLQNPALHNDSSRIVIGLPALSGMYFDFNSGFAVNDLMHKGTGALADSLVLDVDGFYNSLSPTNTVQMNFSAPLFYLGIRSKKSFYSLGISEKGMTRFSFDKALVAFLKDGNGAYMGQNYDLGNLDMDAFHYREYALGYSNEVLKNKLTIGLKAKILFGKSAIQTERLNMMVETAADGSSVNLKSDMQVNVSAPMTVEYDSDGYFSGGNGDNFEAGNYMLQKGNMGMAFDLGAVYKLNSKITLTGSIIDLGKISFKNDLITLNHVSTYKWGGIDFSKSIDDSKADYVDPTDLVDDELEKMGNSFTPKKSEIGADAFDVSLPTKIYLGGTYDLSRQVSFGIVDCLYKNGDISRNTLTVSANALLGNVFSVSGSYSMIGDSYNNVGLGTALRLGFLQLFFVSDNLLALTDPAKAKYVNARFGMNLLFGRN